MRVYKFLLNLSIITTWPLISFGALVRLHGAGLACPDWPLCYGQLIPPPGFSIAMEVGHRFVAVLLGFLIIGLLVASWQSKEIPRRFRAYSWGLLALVLFQGLLGGLTVIYGLHPLTVILHLVFGNGLLFALVCVRFLASRAAGGKFSPPSHQRGKIFVGSMGLLLLLIIASGGLNSSTLSGYYCNAFPLCHPGEPLSFHAEVHTPEKNSDAALLLAEKNYGTQEMIHMAHRILAVFGGLAIIALALSIASASKGNQDRPLAIALAALIVTEAVVGVFNALYLVPIPVSALHTALAATMVLVMAQLFSRHFLLYKK